jgi:hypothetical protein
LGRRDPVTQESKKRKQERKRKLHNVELNNLRPSPNTAEAAESKLVCWEDHV